MCVCGWHDCAHSEVLFASRLCWFVSFSLCDGRQHGRPLTKVSGHSCCLDEYSDTGRCGNSSRYSVDLKNKKKINLCSRPITRNSFIHAYPQRLDVNRKVMVVGLPDAELVQYVGTFAARSSTRHDINSTPLSIYQTQPTSTPRADYSHRISCCLLHCCRHSLLLPPEAQAPSNRRRHKKAGRSRPNFNSPSHANH